MRFSLASYALIVFIMVTGFGKRAYSSHIQGKKVASYIATIATDVKFLGKNGIAIILRSFTSS